MPYHMIMMHDIQHMIDNKLIWLLTILVLIDIFTGYIKAFVNKNTNSSKGLHGLIKHSALVVAIILLYPWLDSAGLNSFGDATVLFYIYNYAVSIVENWGEMGLPVPQFIKDRLVKLQDDYNKFDDNGKGSK